MCASGLKARTVNKYVEYIKQVVKSLKAPNGEPIHSRTWDAETMDLPVVEYMEQKRPSLKAKAVSELIRLEQWAGTQSLDILFERSSVNKESLTALQRFIHAFLALMALSPGHGPAVPAVDTHQPTRFACLRL